MPPYRVVPIQQRVASLPCVYHGGKRASLGMERRGNHGGKRASLGMAGEEGGRWIPCIPLVVVGCTNSGLYASCTPASWVHLASSYAADVIHALTADGRCQLTEHRAQERETPWVGASAPLGVYYPVNVCRRVCAELLPSSRQERHNDRIATGQHTA